PMGGSPCYPRKRRRRRPERMTPMQNAHLRMGKLSFVRQTLDTVTNVTVHLNCLIAEPPPDSRTAAALHLLSVFGGDQDLGAVIAAAHEGLWFELAFGGPASSGHWARNPPSTGHRFSSPDEDVPCATLSCFREPSSRPLLAQMRRRGGPCFMTTRR